MRFKISCAGRNIKTSIRLPFSKSMSNRALIICAISGNNFSIKNLSDAQDTLDLSRILSDLPEKTDCGDGGTTLRFLLAYLALVGKECEMHGSSSLTKRPVAPLVNALNSLGADIVYLGEEGHLPLKINPSLLKKNSVQIDGTVSSQFISALMMIAPYIPGGLTIMIKGEMVSLPYIMMTKSMMEYFGSVVTLSENQIRIEEGKYESKDISIEPDWSAASYWYEIAALSESSEILLEGLAPKSLQGDSVIAVISEKLGVKTEFNEQGTFLIKEKKFTPPEYFSYDFKGCPDIAPAIACACAGLNMTADLHGLKNFRLKESDRASAIQRELYNFDVKTDFCGGSKFKIYDGRGIRQSRYAVNTYNDHRLAMCFAPLALKTENVLIENPEVVKKSYPDYFHDLINAGFSVEED
jgi:3-phosphoshikimate 1-carboxyvinyltransferase